jgi:hypothetical protein
MDSELTAALTALHDRAAHLRGHIPEGAPLPSEYLSVLMLLALADAVTALETP